MSNQNSSMKRRSFLKGAAATVLGAAAAPLAARAGTRPGPPLRVWSCGGLAEAFMAANNDYQQQAGIHVAYTGAFAAALGKSLLGSATTDIFAGRVLALARKLRRAGKMSHFEPLCFTSYVLVTPKGNPARIQSIQDLARPGVRVALSPQASPPGGKAVSALLKKAGMLKGARQNAVILGSCVQRTMFSLCEGKADVSVVELRITRLPAFKDRVETIPIAERYFPAAPLTFTIGVMSQAADPARAEHYLRYITSPQGQAYFQEAGFIPAISEQGRRLVQELGVHDA